MNDQAPTQFELSALPVGFCPACLERAIAGRIYESLRFLDGARLVHAYCSENETGAMLLTGAGRPQEWRLFTPIDALAWRARVASFAEIRNSVRVAIGGGDPAQAAVN